MKRRGQQVRRVYEVTVQFDYPDRYAGDNEARNYWVEAMTLARGSQLGLILALHDFARLNKKRRPSERGYIPRLTKIEELGSIDARSAK